MYQLIGINLIFHMCRCLQMNPCQTAQTCSETNNISSTSVTVSLPCNLAIQATETIKFDWSEWWWEILSLLFVCLSVRDTTPKLLIWICWNFAQGRCQCWTLCLFLRYTSFIKQCYVTLSARRISIHVCTYSITNFPSTLTDCGLSWTTALSKSNNLMCYCGGF